MNNDIVGVYREPLPEAVSADLLTLNPHNAGVNGHLKKNVRMPSKTTSTSFLQYPTELHRVQLDYDSYVRCGSCGPLLVPYLGIKI